MENTLINFSGQSSLDTLAQSGTNKSQKKMITVYGKGADVHTPSRGEARHKRKIIAQKIVLSLIDIASQKKQPERVKEYWNTYYCLDRIYSDGNRIYGKYCKNRICPVCSGNRKAELINKYLPIVNQWSEPYFVTLTIKAVSAIRLKEMMDAVNRGIRLIIEKYKKKSMRNKGIRLVGIKSLECNFNPDRRTYNPHFHLIVPDKQTADILIEEWLYYCNRKGTFWASPKAQRATKIYDNETCLIEVIKYGSKIFTLEGKNKKEVRIYIKALNNILAAMKGIRLFERFGFNGKPIHKEQVVTHLRQYEEFTFDTHLMDWVNIETQQKMNDYSLPEELQHILNNCLDIVID